MILQIDTSIASLPPKQQMILAVGSILVSGIAFTFMRVLECAGISFEDRRPDGTMPMGFSIFFLLMLFISAVWVLIELLQWLHPVAVR